MQRKRRGRLSSKMRGMRAAELFGALVFVLIVLLILYPSEAERPEEEAVRPSEDLSQSAEEDGGAAVYFFDVGQGDSALITVGDYAMLIDAGLRDSWDALEEDLRALGITELDSVVATHPHADHIGAMREVIGAYPIGTFYMPILPDEDLPTTATFEGMLDALEETGTKMRGISTETEIPAPDGARFEVLSPEPGDRFEEMNDYSAVIRFTYGDVSFLLTGDAETEIEERLLAEDVLLSADVLKCGHHGSSSSTSVPFLEAVGPRYAVISCGLDNSYGHPHRETMRALTDYGCEILRTDEGTSFAALTDGTGLEVFRFTPEDGLFDLNAEPAA